MQPRFTPEATCAAYLEGLIAVQRKLELTALLPLHPRPANGQRDSASLPCWSVCVPAPLWTIWKPCP